MAALVRRLPLRYLLWFVALALLVWVLHPISLQEIGAALGRLGPAQILAWAVVNGLVLLTLSGRWWLILRAQGYPIPYLSLAGYRLAAFGISYFTPGTQFGGEPLQVYLVERHHHVPRPTAIAAVSLDKSLELVGNFAFLAGGILCIFQSQAFRGSVLFDAAGRQAVAAALVLLALPVSFLLSIAAGRHPVSGLVRTGARFLPGRRWPALSARLPACREVYELIFVGEVQMTRFCREQSLTVVQALLVSLISWAGALGEYWLALHFLGQNLTLTQALSALTAARLALLVPVPGGLGALEASQVLALRALGISPVVGVSLSLLIRARDVTLGCLGLWWGGVNS